MSNSRRKFIIKNETCALHTDNSGLYTDIRELVVAVVTYDGNQRPFDWVAYRCFVLAEMRLEWAVEIVSESGDKMYGPKAIDLLKYAPGAPQYLATTYYRE